MGENNGNSPLAGLGDIPAGAMEPMERLYQITRGQVNLPRRGWIVQPRWTPPSVPGMEAFQKIFEEHELPRKWQMLEDFFTLLMRGRFSVKSPNWVEPPITAEMADIATSTAVAVAAGDTDILSYEVPDRCVAAFRGLGHQLSVAAEWDNVIWNIKVNKRPIRTYFDFRQQRGMFVSPTTFPRPITLKGKDVITFTARTAGAAVNAHARLIGYVIPAETVTQDGSYKDWMSR